jgi:hypothetical protein
MPHKSKISNTEWGLFIGVCFMVDLVQIGLDLLLIGLGINPFIDLFMSMSFPFYLYMRGENLLDWRRITAMIGSAGGDLISDGVLPLWGLDAVVQMLTSKAQDAASKSS